MCSAALGVSEPGPEFPAGFLANLAALAVLLWGAHTLRSVQAALQQTPVAIITPLVASVTGEAPAPDAIVDAVLAAGAAE